MANGNIRLTLAAMALAALSISIAQTGPTATAQSIIGTLAPVVGAGQ